MNERDTSYYDMIEQHAQLRKKLVLLKERAAKTGDVADSRRLIRETQDIISDITKLADATRIGWYTPIAYAEPRKLLPSGTLARIGAFSVFVVSAYAVSGAALFLWVGLSQLVKHGGLYTPAPETSTMDSMTSTLLLLWFASALVSGFHSLVRSNGR